MKYSEGAVGRMAVSLESLRIALVCASFIKVHAIIAAQRVPYERTLRQERAKERKLVAGDDLEERDRWSYARRE